jgi:hypothetical protein
MSSTAGEAVSVLIDPNPSCVAYALAAQTGPLPISLVAIPCFDGLS